MKAILHQFPGGDGLESVSPPCLRVGLALRFLDIDYDINNLRTRGQVDLVSRTGRLPVLEIDGRKIPDSTAIVDYLEAEYPQSPLFPKDVSAQRQSKLWECYANHHLYWCGYYLRWVDPELTEAFVEAMAGRAGVIQRFLIRKVFVPRQRRRARAVGVAGQTRDEILGRMTRGFDMVEQALQDAPFLSGLDVPGRGDLAVTAIFVQLGFRGSMKELLADYAERKPLCDYARRVYDACKMDRPRWLKESRR